MCCFSQNIEVKNTRIFARPLGFGRQVVVYAMQIAAEVEAAMVLPLPVAEGSGENALRFHDLSKYPDFFAALQAGFPNTSRSAAKEVPTLSANAWSPLEVVKVGAFDASYVPSPADFARLDERFRLPAKVLAGVPAWQDRGFAVFKLRSGNVDVHPMAFDFPVRDDQRIFFPTVHVHDGDFHPTADFDHDLYLQTNGKRFRALLDWDESPQLAGEFVDAERALGLVAADQHVHRHRIRGEAKNDDTWLGEAKGA